jgi:protein phosphatase
MSEATAEASAVTTRRLVVRCAVRTDVGRVRAENQDFATVTNPEEEARGGPGGRLMIVADGMGGHRGGATAARIAAETLKSEYLNAPSGDVGEALRRALVQANTRVYSESEAKPDFRGMGTTASALVIRGNHAWLGHVGDSRIYLLRGDELRQLTDDHSLVASMVREGLISREEAETHPRRNVLQRSVGVGPEVDIDVSGPLAVEAGDTFILCSDGLHGLVKSDEIREVGKYTADDAADEFLRRALSRGAPDNVTVIVVKVDGETVDPEATMKEHAPVSLFDDTFREGPRATPVGPATAAEARERPRPRPQLLWMLLVAVVLCAAAVWMYFEFGSVR